MKSKKQYSIEQQVEILQNSILPKFLSFFQNKQKQIWSNFFNVLIPQKNLGFLNEEKYLKEYNLKKEKIVSNSIVYIFNDIDSDDLEYLTDQFMIFSNSNKIRILNYKDNSLPVYIEIINALEYIKKIETIIDKYPKYDANHLGTKYRSSSYKTLLKSQLNLLENRINSLFFPLLNEDEIKKTQIQIKFITYALKKEYKHLPEWINYINLYIGLDHKLIGATDLEVKAFSQLITFFNGIKTSKEELLKSVTILLRDKSNISIDNKESHQTLAQNISNIVRFFFHNIIQEVDIKNKKRTFNYSKQNISKRYAIKTFLDDTPIYTYLFKNDNDFLQELLENSFKSILGIHNLFDIENPTEKEISKTKMIKNIIEVRNEFGFTKQEFKLLLAISQLQNIQELSINKINP